MILLVGFYEDPDPGRHDELSTCLRCNVANDRLEEVHVFAEEALERDVAGTYPELRAAKVRVVAHGRRVTYRDLFAYAGRRLAGRRVVIANADIYFDDTLARLDAVDLAGRLLCLTRWDVRPDGSATFSDRGDSQDAWIFVAPVRDFSCDFHLGVPGCDNRLAWEADRAGLAVANPSRSVRALHLHTSQVRRYGAGALAGPLKFLPPAELETPAPSAGPAAPDGACAAVAFRETMGYTVARLEPGASSHVNDPRPFTTVPDPLRGLPFTQVVAYAVSPVEVTFRTAGKVYVLVGDDWAGARAATDWLGAAGVREALPSVRTERGTGFDVWSLTGAAGARVVLPTQVMLVAGELTKEGGAPGVPAAPVREAGANREPIFALTSLPPGRERVPRTRECIRSWQRAGLHVRAFNNPDEVAGLAEHYDVEFVAVAGTTESVFGKRLVPVHAMLDWAAERDAPVLLLNADIELRMSEWEVKRERWLADGGLCYFVRYNLDGTGTAEREPFGLDAFLFHGRDAAGFPRALLSLGRPFWDYWLPVTFAARGRAVHAIEYPAAFHRTHPLAWSPDDWHRCGTEFVRCAGEGAAGATQRVADRVRQDIERRKRPIAPAPPGIRDWVERALGTPAPKTVLELGTHRGTDTEWLARLPNVTVHAFEPDPRNHPAPAPNVTVRRAASADRDGTGPLFPSRHGPGGQEWTYSSSIKRPRNHLTRHAVSFGAPVAVELVALDTFTSRQGPASSTSSGRTSRAPRGRWSAGAAGLWSGRGTSTPSTPTTSCTRVRCRCTSWCACSPGSASSSPGRATCC
ncbi:hypothetical protein FTUN_8956 [Frigoriglobus tundricola]|uniref:Uncharacterized protein n=2 Tax=Frigoriglobus tundricola TaxID=2774151 RepID=A0A6M5Z6R2_9BACT|nr:hypothetical protein FTUN_8956 [Frigoriglobus tundricola]